MSLLSDLSAGTPLLEYSQAASQWSINPVGPFLAPLVPTPTAVGRYKQWTRLDRFKIPRTERAVGGEAVDLGIIGVDATFNCQPHGTNVPLDRSVGEPDLKVLRADANSYSRDVAQLKHAQLAINAALAAAGAGTAKVWSGAQDPQPDIDTAILSVMKLSKSPVVGVLFGAGAWQIFNANSNVRSRSPGGFTYALQPALFAGQSEYRTSYYMVDTTPDGVAESIGFLLDATVLIFARSNNPSRVDPSALKTFVVVSDKMVQSEAPSRDGRRLLVKNDWCHDVKVTNAAGIIRLNIS